MMELEAKLKFSTRKAKLIDGQVVPVEDTLEWAEWFETADRQVAHTTLNRRRRIRVSTVFLGLNHDYRGTEKGIWFESMVFGTSIDGAQDRYPDIESARRGHAQMVARARQARQLRGDYSRKARRRALKRMRSRPR
jgi:hypothetical protein